MSQFSKHIGISMTLPLTEIVSAAKELSSPIAQTLGEAWAAVIGDRVAAWRLKNAAQLQLIVNEEVVKLGLKLNQTKIPERYAFAWFEEATKQDEPEIQELFARLLAKAAAGDGDALDRRHLEVLTRFTPMDAKVFQLLLNSVSERLPHAYRREHEVWKEVTDKFGTSAELSLVHLVTLGIIERIFDIKQDSSIGGWHSVDGMRAGDLAHAIGGSLSIDCDLLITPVGVSLWRACSPTQPLK